MKWNACNVDFFRFRFSDFVLKRVLPIPWLFWMQNYRFWFRFWHIYPTLTPKYAFQFIFNLATSTQLLKIDKNTAGESSDIELLASFDDENHEYEYDDYSQRPLILRTIAVWYLVAFYRFTISAQVEIGKVENTSWNREICSSGRGMYPESRSVSV